MKARPVSSSKPKLFFVIPSLQAGGAERVIIALANHFNRLNYTSILISLNHALPGYQIDSGVKVIYLINRVGKNALFRLYYIGKIFFKLLHLLLKEKPVCALSFITSANIWTGVTCTLTNTNYIVSERTSPRRSINQLNSALKRLITSVYKRSAAIVVSAKGVENCLREHKRIKNLNNIYIITNPVTQFKIPSLTRVHHRKFILGVGRLSYVKGFDILIDAFSRTELKDVDLVILGEGEERSNLLKLAQHLCLSERVILPGSTSDLQDYYSQAEMFVLPSRNEGYPNALVEAMSFGCACIAVNCEYGPSEIITNEQNGLLVRAGPVSELSDAIIRLINDPRLKADLSKQALNINHTNNADQIYKQWESLILNPVVKKIPALVYS